MWHAKGHITDLDPDGVSAATVGKEQDPAPETGRSGASPVDVYPHHRPRQYKRGICGFDDRF